MHIFAHIPRLQQIKQGPAALAYVGVAMWGRTTAVQIPINLSAGTRTRAEPRWIATGRRPRFGKEGEREVGQKSGHLGIGMETDRKLARLPGVEQNARFWLRLAVPRLLA